jgi:hypothetical protein
MKIKTNKLTGAALDWAVAKCEDFNDGSAIIRLWNSQVTKIIPGDYETAEVYTRYSPSTDWAQGGPIIEREGISTRWDSADYIGDMLTNVTWSAAPCDEDYSHTGTTPLIAAMRCYVASKLGDEVEVPDGLL